MLHPVPQKLLPDQIRNYQAVSLPNLLEVVPGVVQAPCLHQFGPSLRVLRHSEPPLPDQVHGQSVHEHDQGPSL